MRIIPLLALPLLLSACVSINTSSKDAVKNDSGFYISRDKGSTWTRSSAIKATGGQVREFATESVSTMVADPADHKAMYVGLERQGMLYTLDQGQSWDLAYELGPGSVTAIAVDPKDKCLVYVARNNQVLRTNDCMRSFKTVFTDPSENILVTNIAIDHFNPRIVYIGLSRGDLVKSSDKGDSWQTVYRFDSDIRRLAIDPNDSRRMFIDAGDEGFQKSSDAGASWESLQEMLDSYDIKDDIVDIDISKGAESHVYVSNDKGIVVSTDQGKTWKQLKLIPPSDNAAIVSLALNPKNPKEIHYVTASTFYYSKDGGENWATRPLPSTKNAKQIMADETEEGVLYLGFSKL